MDLNNMTMEEIIKNSEEIMMDTASLMEVESLDFMLERHKETFINLRKMITIPGVVCQELVRHLASENEDKKEKANKALKIIRNNAEIFTVEFAEYTPEEIKKAFADREILLRLTSSRAKKRQLLITNDRSLSRDAFNLNLLESCSGKPVQVCYLSRYGELCKCHCDDKQQPKSEQVKVIVQKEPVYVEVAKEPKTGVADVCGYIIGAFALFGAGYGTCKYGSSIMKLVKNIF